MTAQFEAIIRRRPQAETNQARELPTPPVSPAENHSSKGLDQFMAEAGSSQQSVSVKGPEPTANGTVMINIAPDTSLVPSSTGGGMKISLMPQASLQPRDRPSRTEFGSVKSESLQQLHQTFSGSSTGGGAKLNASHRSVSLRTLEEQTVRATYRVICVSFPLPKR